MARRPAGMEPAPEIVSYDDVAWYRKQWFAWVLVLFFFPPLLFIAATGDMYAKANRKMKEHSPAAVWRYSGGGKAMLFIAGLIFAALFVVQLVVAITAEDDSRPRRATPAEPAEEDLVPTTGQADAAADTDQVGAEVGTTAPATTVAPTTTPAPTTTIVAGPVGEVIGEIRALAEQGFVAGDTVSPVAAIVDAFPAVPVPADATLTDIVVSGEIGTSFREGTVLFNVFSNYETASSPTEVVALYRSEAAAADLPEREVVEDEDDEGPYVDLDLGDFSSHPDPGIEWAALRLRIRVTDTGSTVRASFSVTRPGGELPPDSLLSRLAAATPSGSDYELDKAEISIRAFGDTMSVSSFVDIVAPRIVADGDGDAAEIAAVTALYLDQGEFVVDTADADRVRFDLPIEPDASATASIGYKDDEVTHLYNRTSLDSF